jgi:L-lactate dehydrogenase complex protein LldE
MDSGALHSVSHVSAGSRRHGILCYDLAVESKEVSLFIPCLVDQVYPEIGLDMARILERLGYRVTYDPRQTCCGQPAFNAGHRDQALCVARQFVEVFSRAETIVCPSGSCTAMVRNFYPVLFEEDARLSDATALGPRVFEFSEFLVKEGKVASISGSASGRVGFHNSCHSYRELGLSSEPRAVLGRISGFELVEVEGDPTCCGFGGVFCVKFRSISEAMARTRLGRFREKGANIIVANDPGCVWHFRQEVAEKGWDVRICHLAEFVAEAMGLREPSVEAPSGEKIT